MYTQQVHSAEGIISETYLIKIVMSSLVIKAKQKIDMH
jgi:hypothetical protein